MTGSSARDSRDTVLLLAAVARSASAARRKARIDELVRRDPTAFDRKAVSQGAWDSFGLDGVRRISHELSTGDLHFTPGEKRIGAVLVLALVALCGLLSAPVAALTATGTLATVAIVAEVRANRRRKWATLARRAEARFAESDRRTRVLHR